MRKDLKYGTGVKLKKFTSSTEVFKYLLEELESRGFHYSNLYKCKIIIIIGDGDRVQYFWRDPVNFYLRFSYL